MSGKSEPLPCTGVVIVAAGEGTRLGLGIPKAFVQVAGEPMLAHTLRGLTGIPGNVAVAVAVPPGNASCRETSATLLRDELGGLGDRLVSIAVVDGGVNRHESVRASLAALPEHCDIVLVHDAARALASADFIARIVGTVRATRHGIVPGLPVVDTIKRVDASSRVLETVDRESLRAVQTPQGFPFAQLRAAYEANDDATTDDAATFAAAGGTVEIVAGEPTAFKITTPEDLERAEELILQRRNPTALAAKSASTPSRSPSFDPSAAGNSVPSPGAAGDSASRRAQAPAADQASAQNQLRVGVGTDIHAFDDDSPCWLAGIHFPGERGLSGHSDGDAVSHAIVDAVLGAAGLGSIGSVFGTTDPRFENAHGSVFLDATRTLLAERGCEVQNVSVQVICKRPRFGDRASEAASVLTEALGAPVSVSATTSDGLGFMGAEEGVFAIATALVLRP